MRYSDHVGLINYKDYAMQEHLAVLDLERGQLGDIRPLRYRQQERQFAVEHWSPFRRHDTGGSTAGAP